VHDRLPPRNRIRTLAWPDRRLPQASGR